MYIYLDFVTEFSCKMCGRCCRNEWLVTLMNYFWQAVRAARAGGQGPADELERVGAAAQLEFRCCHSRRALPAQAGEPL